jgi:YHS domain-containing protein
VLRVILIGILLIVIARLFWRLFDAVLEGTSGKPRGHVRAGVKLQRDPVCGTFVAPDASLSLTVRGATQYFCSEKCRNEYVAR